MAVVFFDSDSSLSLSLSLSLSGAIHNLTHVHMDFVSHNHQYYKLPKYSDFLLNNPVYRFVGTQLTYTLLLTFVFLCIASTITIDNQQDATVLIYLL